MDKDLNRTQLSAEEKRILRAISEALPLMRERDKGYLLGMAECMAVGKRKQELVQQ